MEAPSQTDPAEAHPARRAIIVYGLLLLTVITCAVVAVWALVERRRLDDAITPLPLPELTAVTTRPDASVTAAWVALLENSSYSPSVVTPEQLSAGDSVIIILDTAGATAEEIDHVLKIVRSTRRGTILTAATDPGFAKRLGVEIEEVEGSEGFVSTPAPSPVMARVRPDHVFGHSGASVDTLRETATMSVDARWENTSRAAVAHWTEGEERYVWLGFDPERLNHAADAELRILLRAAGRWADRQPISDGALVSETGAPAFSPEQRTAARDGGLAFSVDATAWPGIYSLRAWNRGDSTLDYPAVAIWVPGGEGAEPSLWGSPILHRFTEAIPQKDYHVVRFHSLNPGEERLVAVELE